MRVCCFSEDGASVPMYAHYAKEHSGCCLKFEVDNKFFNKAEAVSYTDNYPSIKWKSTQEEKRKTLKIKAKCWEYEKEWRLIKREDDIEKDRNYQFPPNLLIEIILGYKVSDKDKKYIQGLIKKSPSNITLYQAKPHESQYKMEIIKL